MNWLTRWFTEEIGLKLISFALAGVIWTVLATDKPTEILFKVPLEFQNVPAGASLSAEPAAVELRVRGPHSIMRKMEPSGFAVAIDLGGTNNPGELNYPLTAKDVEAPLGLEVVEIRPLRVRVHLKELQENF